MQANEEQSNSYQKRTARQLADRTMISLERSQKLDLLIHLLTNLRQALIVCGPEGIGKTTLLQSAQHICKDRWWVCLLQGGSSLSFETIMLHLSRFLNLSDATYGFNLSELRNFCQQQKVVLMIDDAGDLAPGLIGQLLDFAVSLPEFRLVISMTYDQFHIKCATDKIIEEFHFIELPPLNQKECETFLQNMSAQPNAMLAFDAVTESLVAQLFRQTHGIPGKILAELPKLKQIQNRKKGKKGLWIAMIILSGIGLVWVLQNNLALIQPKIIESSNPGSFNENNSVSESVITQNDSMIVKDLPIPSVSESKLESSSNATSPDLEKKILENAATSTESNVEIQSEEDDYQKHSETSSQQTNSTENIVQASSEAKLAVDKIAEPAAEKKNTPNPYQENPLKIATDFKSDLPNNELNNQRWINAQPANNYTLQVMVLSSKESVSRLLKKYKEFSDSLKCYTIKNSNQEKYVVIYGSFPSIADAKKYKAIMPPEFSQSLEKRFKFIQKNGTH